MTLRDSDAPSSDGAASGVELAPGVRAPQSAVRFQFARSGGPGGQNVNKLNTKAELWVTLDAISGLSLRALARLRALGGRRVTAAGEIHLVSETERGQEGNRAAVVQRLREMIVAAKVEPKVRKKVKPSKRAKAKRLDAKRRRGEIKAKRRGHGGEW
jgi:ribosome-associated protein